MEDVARLMAIEDIKQLKARYFRSLDTQDWPLMRDHVFAQDIICDFRGSTTDPITGFNPAPEATSDILRGADTALAAIAAGMAGVRSVHHGHMPEIAIIDDTRATGIWAMFDSLQMKKGPVREITRWGHYHEDYIHMAAGWRIAKMRLKRLRLDYVMVS